VGSGRLQGIVFVVLCLLTREMVTGIEDMIGDVD
jgi:hypothetical protein